MLSILRILPVWLAVVPILLFSAVAVKAEPVVVTFSGVIDTVDDPGALLPMDISVGTPFSGTYTYDSVPAGAPSEFGPLEYGCWLHPVIAESAELTVTVGSNVLALEAPQNLTICDNLPGPINSWGTPTTAFNGIQPSVGFGDTTAQRIADGRNDPCLGDQALLHRL